MKGRNKGYWDEKEKYTLWLFYNHNVSLKKIGHYMGKSHSAINHALTRYKIRNTSHLRRKGVKPSHLRVTHLQMKNLCLSAGLEPHKPPFSINSSLFPNLQPPWQTLASQVTLRKRKASVSFKNHINEKKCFHTYYDLSHVMAALESYNFSVIPLKEKCPYLHQSLYIVNGKDRMILSQLIILLNKIRQEKGLKAPILVEGVTDGGNINE